MYELLNAQITEQKNSKISLEKNIFLCLVKVVYPLWLKNIEWLYHVYGHRDVTWLGSSTMVTRGSKCFWREMFSG